MTTPRIGLLRHFPVDQAFPRGWRTAAELEDWLARYDRAPVLVGAHDLGGVDWRSCLASDLPRARITADTVFGGPVEHTGMLREARFVAFDTGRLRLPGRPHGARANDGRPPRRRETRHPGRLPRRHDEVPERRVVPARVQGAATADGPARHGVCVRAGAVAARESTDGRPEHIVGTTSSGRPGASPNPWGSREVTGGCRRYDILRSFRAHNFGMHGAPVGPPVRDCPPTFQWRSFRGTRSSPSS